MPIRSQTVRFTAYNVVQHQRATKEREFQIGRTHLPDVAGEVLVHQFHKTGIHLFFICVFSRLFGFWVWGIDRFVPKERLREDTLTSKSSNALREWLRSHGKRDSTSSRETGENNPPRIVMPKKWSSNNRFPLFQSNK